MMIPELSPHSKSLQRSRKKWVFQVWGNICVNNHTYDLFSNMQIHLSLWDTMMKGLLCHTKAWFSNLLSTDPSVIFFQTVLIFNCPFYSCSFFFFSFFFSFFPSFFPFSLMLLLCPSFTFNFIWKEAMCVNKILISPVATLKLGLVMRPSFQQVKCKCKVEILVKAVRKTIAFQIKRARMRLRSLSLLLFGFTFPPIYNIDRVSLLPSWGQILRVMGQEKD